MSASQRCDQYMASCRVRWAMRYDSAASVAAVGGRTRAVGVGAVVWWWWWGAGGLLEAGSNFRGVTGDKVMY